MANERLFLVCRHCVDAPEISVENCVFFFAKYYPQTGWYTVGTDLQSALDAWFADHVHGTLMGQFVTMFQSDFDPASRSKKEILTTIRAYLEERT